MPQPRINLPHFRPVTAGLAVTNAKLCIQWSQTRAACSLYSARDALCWVFDSCGITEKTLPLAAGKGTEFLHHTAGDGCLGRDHCRGNARLLALFRPLTKYVFPSSSLFLYLTSHSQHRTQFFSMYSGLPPLPAGSCWLSLFFPGELFPSTAEEGRLEGLDQVWLRVQVAGGRVHRGVCNKYLGSAHFHWLALKKFKWEMLVCLSQGAAGARTAMGSEDLDHC